ncbi:MAG: PHB depolymerase family esterase [Dokdonella sp.]
MLEIRQRIGSARIRCVQLGLLALLAVVTASCAKQQSGAALPALKVDSARMTVVGLSSGAYMATQAHVAYSDRFMGAGLVAGGPYGCAGGKLEQALGPCMKAMPAPPDVKALVESANARASRGEIASLSNLAHSHVYALHGKKDATVAEAVSRASATFYEMLRDSAPELAAFGVTWDGDRDFAHLLPLAASGDACDKSETPFLGKCGFDAAGAIFAALYGAPQHAATEASGELRQFDQNTYRQKGVDTYLADSGYVYVPRACVEGKPCGVMVAFHGCQQNAESVGEAFVRDGGFNRWADVYDVAVLYPQTHASLAPLNPKACWDWWGYSGADYDTRNSAQLRWLMRALDALGGKAG